DAAAEGGDGTAAGRPRGRRQGLARRGRLGARDPALAQAVLRGHGRGPRSGARRAPARGVHAGGRALARRAGRRGSWRMIRARAAWRRVDTGVAVARWWA